MSQHTLASRLFPCFTILAIFLVGCSSTETIRTDSWEEYKIGQGSETTKQKGDIEIQVTPIPPSATENHPELFRFTWREIGIDPGFGLTMTYSEGGGWEHPLSHAQRSKMVSNKQAILCRVRIDNGTDHILRMENARIYLVPDGGDPVEAVSSIEELQSLASQFEREIRIWQQEEGGLIQVELPPNFFSRIISSHQEAYDLIASLDTEILPDRSYEGLLVFPPFQKVPESATVSFYDVTTETDEAGNPTERVQFDFPLKKTTVKYWYDPETEEWKEGTPPQPSASQASQESG